MKRVIWVLTCAVLAGCPSVLLAQAPTEKAVASTAEQEAAIRRGVALHDQGKFDEAIAAYEAVLKDSPANTTALYELAYSLVEKKDYARALEEATRGTRYQSDELPMFYDLLGSAHDLMGEPQKAIDAYTRGIAVVPDASMLYYNMAITYLESLKNPDQARLTLERAAAINPTEGQIHLMLGQVMQSNGYPVPSLFAFATALIYEPTGSQALRAYGFLRAALRGGVEGMPSGQSGTAMRDGAMRNPATAAPRPSSKTAEGDFAALEARLATGQRQFIAALDGGGTEIEALVPQVSAFFRDLAARDLSRDRGTFTGRHYLPYFVEIQKRGFVEPFLFWSIQRSPVQGVKEWLTANEPKVKAFLDWTKAYQWPRP